MPSRPRPATAARAPRILIVRLGAVGDVVRTLPALNALRSGWPQAHLRWVVEPGSAPLLRDHPELDSVVVFPRKELSRLAASPTRWREGRERLRAFRDELSNGPLDIALDFQGTVKSAAIAWMSGAARRLGFDARGSREGAHLLYTERIPDPGRRVRRMDKAFALVEAAGVSVASPTAQLPPLAADSPRLAEFFGSPALAGRPHVVLYPGSSEWQRYKRWPADAWARLAQRLGASGERAVVLAWGPGEEAIVEHVASRSRGAVVVAPATTLLELAELIRRAELFVGGDTGPMHLAWAVGTRVLALYGPTDPEVNAPYGDGHAQLWAGVDCSPCRYRACPDRRCLDAITPQAVADTADRLLQIDGTAHAATTEAHVGGVASRP